MTQNYVVYGTSGWNEGRFRTAFYDAYDREQLAHKPSVSLRFTKPLPVEVADKWGSNHPDDVFVQVIPPDQISQAQREAFLDCVRAAAAACGTSSCPVR